VLSNESRQSMTLLPSYRYLKITKREESIIMCLADDLIAKEIAGQLGISTKTVQFHVQNIRRKLGVHGNAGVIRWAIRMNLLQA
jgi:DNA-binding CsgD family transcriptional regulator